MAGTAAKKTSQQAKKTSASKGSRGGSSSSGRSTAGGRSSASKSTAAKKASGQRTSTKGSGSSSGRGSRTYAGSSSGRSSGKRSQERGSSGRSSSGYRRSASSSRQQEDQVVRQDIVIIALFAAMVFLFLSNFGILGPVGNIFSEMMFGLCGFTAYILPVFIFACVLWYETHLNDRQMPSQIAAATGIFLCLGMIGELSSGDLDTMVSYDIANLYNMSSQYRHGGGILAGSLAYLFNWLFGIPGTVLIIVVAMVLCIVVLSQRSLLSIVGDSASRARAKRIRQREAEERYRMAHPDEFRDDDFGDDYDEEYGEDADEYGYDEEEPYLRDYDSNEDAYGAGDAYEEDDEEEDDAYGGERRSRGKRAHGLTFFKGIPGDTLLSPEMFRKKDKSDEPDMPGYKNGFSASSDADEDAAEDSDDRTVSGDAWTLAADTGAGPEAVTSESEAEGEDNTSEDSGSAGTQKESGKEETEDTLYESSKDPFMTSKAYASGRPGCTKKDTKEDKVPKVRINIYGSRRDDEEDSDNDRSDVSLNAYSDDAVSDAGNEGVAEESGGACGAGEGAAKEVQGENLSFSDEYDDEMTDDLKEDAPGAYGSMNDQYENEEYTSDGSEDGQAYDGQTYEDQSYNAQSYDDQTYGGQAYDDQSYGGGTSDDQPCAKENLSFNAQNDSSYVQDESIPLQDVPGDGGTCGNGPLQENQKFYAPLPEPVQGEENGAGEGAEDGISALPPESDERETAKPYGIPDKSALPPVQFFEGVTPISIDSDPMQLEAQYDAQRREIEKKDARKKLRASENLHEILPEDYGLQENEKENTDNLIVPADDSNNEKTAEVHPGQDSTAENAGDTASSYRSMEDLLNAFVPSDIGSSTGMGSAWDEHEGFSYDAGTSFKTKEKEGEDKAASLSEEGRQNASFFGDVLTFDDDELIPPEEDEAYEEVTEGALKTSEAEKDTPPAEYGQDGALAGSDSIAAYPEVKTEAEGYEGGEEYDAAYAAHDKGADAPLNGAAGDNQGMRSGASLRASEGRRAFADQSKSQPDRGTPFTDRRATSFVELYDSADDNEPVTYEEERPFTNDNDKNYGNGSYPVNENEGISRKEDTEQHDAYSYVPEGTPLPSSNEQYSGEEYGAEVYSADEEIPDQGAAGAGYAAQAYDDRALMHDAYDEKKTGEGEEDNNKGTEDYAAFYGESAPEDAGSKGEDAGDSEDTADKLNGEGEKILPGASKEPYPAEEETKAMGTLPPFAIRRRKDIETDAEKAGADVPDEEREPSFSAGTGHASMPAFRQRTARDFVTADAAADASDILVRTRGELSGKKEIVEQAEKKDAEKAAGSFDTEDETPTVQPIKTEAPAQVPKYTPRAYVYPPMDLLKSGTRVNAAESETELRETAAKLQSTLETFGVRVHITEISQGPAVTRYEMQPELGVKVSRIISLQDDIKLALAATDIRIEAPIPGKSAVGIEVPNRNRQIVSLRDILDTDEFRNAKSKTSFGVGKDIAGKTVIADIAKMPHVLIAGSTGSGKSVCINTIIMSILYHASPKEVQLIMIDPKVVELSVYNGIPHLMLPVVTDPQKAAATLNWAVAEMETRFKKFADNQVRDIKGYNALVKSKELEGEDDPEFRYMPHLVVIVDELADLMMVAKSDVETAICRLAQLARAAGIHLVIATQRPSVDVITGLIKANMPSRIAFAVTSGVDSRTILDMNGAEKLLGKGDMLFFPQGIPKPVRIQGAFVSDDEVTAVVNFLKTNDPPENSPEELAKKIDSMAEGQEGHGSGSEESENRGPDIDDLFVDAGRFIIEKNSASIGLLQRRFRIGFNRAARIMDQLCDAGVVAQSEGTKTRKILMTEAEFNDYVDNYL